MASEIRNPQLWQDGRLKIDWVRHHMPLLNGLEEEFRATLPFKGMKVALSVHLEAKTAYLCEVLAAGGAEMYVTGSNPLSTQDDVAAALVKAGLNVFAWYGGDGCVGTNEGLKIPYGEDCPEVYMDFFNLEAEGESVHKEVRMRKNHCIATIYVRTEEAFPYRLVVKGEVDGYDPDGTPSFGHFMCELELSESMNGRVTLPRQRDESLCLEVCAEDSVLKVFTLGRYISATGYDWTAEHLEDLTLTLDYTHNVIGITIGEWDKEHHFDISI